METGRLALADEAQRAMIEAFSAAKESMVYFVQCGERVKIGTSKCLPARLSRLQTSAPERLVVIGVRIGDDRAERALHKKYEKYRTSGEWFVACPEIIEEAKSQTLVNGVGRLLCEVDDLRRKVAFSEKCLKDKAERFEEGLKASRKAARDREKRLKGELLVERAVRARLTRELAVAKASFIKEGCDRDVQRKAILKALEGVSRPVDVRVIAQSVAITAGTVKRVLRELRVEGRVKSHAKAFGQANGYTLAEVAL